MGLCCGKSSAPVVEKNQPILNTQKSVKLSDTIDVSLEKDKKKHRWHSLFGHVSKQKAADKQTTNGQTKTSEKSKKSKKPSRIFGKKSNKVHPIQQDVNPKKLSPAAPHQEVTTEIKPPQGKKEKKPNTPKKIIKTLKIHVKEARSTLTTKLFHHDHFKKLGLPNPAQYCYMNSCLQSLLTLEEFSSTISSQEQVWDSHPESALLRSFMEVKKAYFSPDLRRKIPLLVAFKRIVSLRNPEFRDLRQKDAHEFLTSVFQQMRDLGTRMDKSYMCPVESLMSFKMENTRTCKGCGVGSIRQEEFTNLSLDMLPGCGSVDELLMSSLKEVELEYRCECGSISSGLSSSFANLPRVLVLHLKRFRYSPSYKLEKVCDPIHLNRDLVVSTKQDGFCYSLVSIVNHMGNQAGSGHYICDGVDPDVKVEDPTDRWFTYDDAWVSKTSGAAVCDQRPKSAYIVFYKRQDSVENEIRGTTPIGGFERTPPQQNI